jgi:predicted NUDIX family phosphoesterase
MSNNTTQKKHQEHILAIPAHLANDLIDNNDGKFIGLLPVKFTEDDLYIARRAGLEANASFRQLISYALVRCRGRYATYRRTPKGNEARLHGQVSIGFGGHHDLIDLIYEKDTGIVNLEETLRVSMEREISEELDLNGSKMLSFEILDSKIVSTMSPVDEVHIGIVAIIELDADLATAGEEQLDFVGFKTLDELDEMENKENWTTALIEYLKAA